jgi:hypothetical protein
MGAPRLGGRRTVGGRVGLLTAWPPRRWAVALGGAALATLALGLPTDAVPNPLYTRMTPVRWWDYPVLAASAALLGLTLATYVAAPDPGRPIGMRRAGAGGMLSLFAIGCPVCNKLVVLAIGFSGALRWFAPIQPALAVASLALVAMALWVRLGGELACRLPSQPQNPQ